MKSEKLIFALLLGVALGWVGGSVRSPPSARTVWVRDTIREKVFVPRDVRVVRVDTLVVHDTVRVPLPIEQKVYASKDYRLVVEGFRPELAALEIYRKTPRPKRWGVGVQAGYGVSEKGLSPYIGVGISYNVLNF